MGAGSSSMRGKVCKSSSKHKLQTKKSQKDSPEDEYVKIFVIESTDHKLVAIGAVKGEEFKYFSKNSAPTAEADPHLSAKIAFLQEEAPELLGDMCYWTE